MTTGDKKEEVELKLTPLPYEIKIIKHQTKSIYNSIFYLK
jgi:hypothetical protein